MTGVGTGSEELVERRNTAAFIDGAGSVGFLVAGLVALLLSPHYHGSSTGVELLGAGVVGIAAGIFLCVAVVAALFNQSWLRHWDE